MTVRRPRSGLAQALHLDGGQGVQVIYVNDNYGRWNSSMQDLVDEVMAGEHAELLGPLVPDGGSSFV